MANASDDPIVILSDDDSDNDDVVLIKEEIEVDCEDVIFLSETKPDPPSTTTRHEETKSPESGVSLSRTNSLATCTDQLSLDDSLDLTIPSKDESPLTSLSDHTSPLDLSAKCSPAGMLGSCDTGSGGQGHSGMIGNCDTGSVGQGHSDTQNGSQADDPLVMLLQDAAKWASSKDSMDTSDKTMHVPHGGLMVNVTSSDSNAANNSLCTNTNSDKSFTNSLCNTSCIDSRNPTVPVSQVTSSQDFDWLMSYINSPTVTSSQSAVTHIPASRSNSAATSKVSSASAYSNPVQSVIVESTLTQVNVHTNKVVPSSSDSSTHSAPNSVNTQTRCDKVQDDSISSNQSFIGANVCGANTQVLQNVPADPFAAGHMMLYSLSASNSSSQNMNDQNSLSTIAMSSSSDMQQTTSRHTSDTRSCNAGLLGGSQTTLLHRLSSDRKRRQSDDSQTLSSSSGPEFKRSLSSSDKMNYYNSLTLPLSQKNPPYKRSASTSVLGSSCADVGSVIQPRGLLRNTCNTDSPRSPSPPSTAPITNYSPQSPTPANQHPTSSCTTAIPLDAPLNTPLSLPSSKYQMKVSSPAFKTSTPYSQSSASTLIHTIRSLTSTPPSPSSQFTKPTLFSSTTSWNQNKTSSYMPRSPSPQNSHQLPPKKQRRCYSNICTNCGTNLTGEKSSQCPNGHSTCTKCLEERVKLVLTGKAKESVKCLNASCDSYYPISELRQSLPAMVVEILEDKLDQDYVDFISDMIMKNAADEIDESLVAGGDGDHGNQEERKYVKRFEDCPGNWDPMDEREVNKNGYVLVPLETGSSEYEDVVVRFFASMIDQNVEVTSVHRVQNPIQWKYYTVKKAEMVQDSEGFGSVVEGQLFHGTMSSTVEAICRKGFDWRLCGKHGTLYGQGSYFALNASYSHQYTDLRRMPGPGSIMRTSSMTLPQPMSMTPPSLLFPPHNVNFGQLNLPPSSSSASCNSVLQSLVQYHPMNLSNNALGQSQPVGPQGPGSAFHPAQIPQNVQGPSSNMMQMNSQQASQQNQMSAQQTLTGFPQAPQQQQQPVSTSSQSVGSQPGTSTKPVCPHQQCSLTKCYQRKILPKPLAIKNISGLASTALATNMEGPPEQERRKAKMFFAKVLVGKYVNGTPKLRKPPPLYPMDDPFGKCFDSCVDNVFSPKIFVIFDSSQAYPEYLLEYAYGRS